MLYSKYWWSSSIILHKNYLTWILSSGWIEWDRIRTVCTVHSVKLVFISECLLWAWLIPDEDPIPLIQSPKVNAHGHSLSYYWEGPPLGHRVPPDNNCVSIVKGVSFLSSNIIYPSVSMTINCNLNMVSGKLRTWPNIKSVKFAEFSIQYHNTPGTESRTPHELQIVFNLAVTLTILTWFPFCHRESGIMQERKLILTTQTSGH